MLLQLDGCWATSSTALALVCDNVMQRLVIEKETGERFSSELPRGFSIKESSAFLE